MSKDIDDNKTKAKLNISFIENGKVCLDECYGTAYHLVLLFGSALNLTLNILEEENKDTPIVVKLFKSKIMDRTYQLLECNNEKERIEVLKRLKEDIIGANFHG